MAKRKTTTKRRTRKLSTYNLFMKKELPKQFAKHPKTKSGRKAAFKAAASAWKRK